MNNKFHVPKFVETLVPFIIAGIAIALFIGILFMFSYVVLWGLLIGGALWLISLIKGFFAPTLAEKPEVTQKKGRIIEHNDEK